MKTRNLAITVGVLALLSLVAVFVKGRGKSAGLDPRVGKPIVGNDTIKSTGTIVITENGKTVTLHSNADHTDWRVKEYYDFPVDFSKLTRTVDSLQNTKIQRFVTASPDRLSRLSLGQGKISFLDNQNKPLLAITLGKTADSGGRFLAYDDEKKAYLADLQVYLDTEPRSWAESKLIPATAEQVQSFTVNFPTGDPITVTRKSPTDDWEANAMPADKQLVPSEVNSLLNKLVGLSFSDTADPEQKEVTEAKRHARHASIRLFDGTSYQIDIGRQPAPPPPEKPASTEPAPPATSQANSSATPPATTATEKPATAEKKPAPPAPKPGPVYVFVQSSKADDAVNQMMTRRAFQVSDYNFTSLPQSRDALLQAAKKADEKSGTPAPGGKKSS